MSAARSLLALPLALTLGLGSGCASIPEPEAVPPQLFADANPLPLRVAIGEVEVTLAVEERTKARVESGGRPEEERYSLAEVIDYRRLRQELAGWVSSGGAFARVRVAEGRNAADRLQDAWLQREDLVLDLELKGYRTTFEGHNWLWIPNVINWAYWIVPSWFIATEEYSLELSALARLRPLGGGAPVAEAEFPVRVAGTFGEFERGWQFFGPIYPMNGRDNWRAIAKALWPAARAQLGRRLATALREEAEGIRAKLEGRELRKTLVLTVGVSHYEDTVRFPTLPRAADDARAVGAALAHAVGVSPRQVLTRLDADASLEGVDAALAELQDRARPGDAVVVYFASYGTRDPDGGARLLLNGEGGHSELPLEALAKRLAPVAGSKLVILDCGFDAGQARTVVREAAAPAPDELERFARESGAGVLSASQPGSPMLVPGHLEQSLFAHCVIEALTGLADRDRDLRLSFAELSDYVRRKTTAESAFLGPRPQRPRASGGEGFVLRLREEAK